MNFSLINSIDSSADNRKDDVLNTKLALRELGFYQGPMSVLPNKDMFDGIEAFQTATGLAPDRVMHPEGPTAQLMSSLLSGQHKGEGGNPDDPNPEAFVNVNAVATINVVAAASLLLAAAAVVVIPVSVLGHGPDRRRRG